MGLSLLVAVADIFNLKKIDVLIIGSGIISDACASKLSSDLTVSSISSRQFESWRGAWLEHWLSARAVVFSGYLCRKLSNDYESLLYNLRLTNRVIEFLRVSSTCRAIFLSTVDVYGSAETMPSSGWAVNDKVSPSDYYSLAKYSSEQMLLNEISAEKCQISIVRCPGLYGAPGDSSLIELWLSSAIQNKPFRVNVSPALERNFLFTDDLFDFVLRVVQEKRGNGHKKFLLGDGRSYSLSSLANNIVKRYGGSIEPFCESNERAQQIKINDQRSMQSLGLEYTELMDALDIFVGRLREKRV